MRNEAKSMFENKMH